MFALGQDSWGCKWWKLKMSGLAVMGMWGDAACPGLAICVLLYLVYLLDPLPLLLPTSIPPFHTPSPYFLFLLELDAPALHALDCESPT